MPKDLTIRIEITRTIATHLVGGLVNVLRPISPYYKTAKLVDFEYYWEMIKPNENAKIN